MMYGYGVGHGFGLFGELFSLIFWVLIIWLVVSLVKKGAGQDGKSCCGGGSASMEGSCCGKKNDDSATALLRERFAKGEISKEEFEEKLQVLEGKKTA